MYQMDESPKHSGEWIQMNVSHIQNNAGLHLQML
jgi:hypothetical protein